MVTFSTLWAKVLASVEAQGVDCEVTLKTLSLGAANATTGHYSTFYADSTLHLIAVDPSVGFSALGCGTHGQLTTQAHSDPAVEVKHGDRILDQFSHTWEILTVAPHVVGDVLVHYKLLLALIEPVELGSSPEGGVAPGRGIGVAEPIQLHIELEHWTEIISPTVAEIDLTNWTEIITPTVAAIATDVYVTPGLPRWFIDGAYHIYGAIAPQGWQTVASAATQAFTADADTANGYVVASATPFALDDATYHHGAVSAAGQGSYTVPAQTNNTLHQIKASYAVGWGLYASGCTVNGYTYQASGATRAKTRAGANHLWYLDTVLVHDGTTYTVPAQTDGTYHTIECTA